ncbi:MAG TPA: LysR family transcriptional regulator [Caldimonas sp.]|jgi:DNA-binding transcriptional LysR family regulator|nr:LysR family transcriptional regulator [Caldimonas sp.]HEX2541402.1 LysR family transcriptional regulator [Caldimonas sp.]
MDLPLRYVRAFLSVAKLGSFTRAAQSLHVSQPALTVQVRSLEDALKVRLLDRTSRSVALTRVGRELVPLFERTLTDLDAIVTDAHEQSAGRRGTVRIACLPSFAASLLPVVMEACRRDQPGVGFVVRDAVASQVMALVRDGEVDLGLTGGDIAADDLDILFRGKDRLCAVFPARHPLALKTRITIADLAETTLVLTDSATSVRAVVDAAFVRYGRRPHIACETTYMMTAVAMVHTGLGVTILPGSARERSAFPGLRSRPIQDPSFVRPIALVKRRGRSLSTACESFAAACIAAMKKGTDYGL